MNLIIYLVVGGVIGWIASIIMHTDSKQGPLLNIVVGIVGAILAGLFVSPLLGSATINQGDFSLSGLIVSLLGSILLLGIVNLVRRGTAR
ncbi:MAG: GlsB/YeaQ/YmgE family stress response membrane protein [Thermoanaerobaculia bacterium]